MDPEQFLDHLQEDASALADAARTAPSAPVPTCPDWDMTALVRHVSGIHRWVTEIVLTGATQRLNRHFSEGERDHFPTSLAGYEEGAAALLSTLERADPDAMVWNWFDRKPAPARFWFRRMAHETAVHRWDAQRAAGEACALNSALAVDGIEEFLTFVSRWLPDRPVAGLSGSLHLHATDCDGEWSLTLSPDHLEHRNEHSKADAAVRGSASDLMLWLVNRKPASAEGLDVFGDRAIVDGWRNLSF
jgi:uncharacterized protein (TIGR03083 family)